MIINRDLDSLGPELAESSIQKLTHSKYRDRKTSERLAPLGGRAGQRSRQIHREQHQEPWSGAVSLSQADRLCRHRLAAIASLFQGPPTARIGHQVVTHNRLIPFRRLDEHDGNVLCTRRGPDQLSGVKLTKLEPGHPFGLGTGFNVGPFCLTDYRVP
jgi:hypothetical protein